MAQLVKYNIAVRDGSVKFTGIIHTSGPNHLDNCRGTLSLNAPFLAWPNKAKPVLICHGLQASALVHYWHDAHGQRHIHLRSGKVTFAALSLSWLTFSNGQITLSVRKHILAITALAAHCRQAAISATGHYNLALHTGLLVASVTNLHEHLFLRRLYPTHVDAHGVAALTLHLNLSSHGQISATAHLKGIGPGLLRLRDLPIVASLVHIKYTGVLASAILQDMRDYPYAHENVAFFVGAASSKLTLEFLRGNGNPGHIPNRKFVYQGHVVIFRPNSLRSIRISIPMPGATLPRLLQLLQQFSQAKY
ncbi:MAG: hypothetical protein HKL96_12740 [Phycisphaerales bacterium]|nr:hypothetical protein [Phycisphaerales bacterium]